MTHSLCNGQCPALSLASGGQLTLSAPMIIDQNTFPELIYANDPSGPGG